MDPHATLPTRANPLPRQERWRSFSLIFLENIQVECTDPLPAVRAISDSSTTFVWQGGRGSSAQSSSSEKSPQSLSPLHRSRLFMHLPAIKIRKDTVCLMPHFLSLSEVIKCNLMLKGSLDVFVQNHILMAHLGSPFTLGNMKHLSFHPWVHTETHNEQWECKDYLYHI